MRSWVTGVGVVAGAPDGAGRDVDVANGVDTVEFGTAGPEASTRGGPGVSVEETRIGLGVGVSAGAADVDPPQPVRTRTVARTKALNFEF
jgi:hypothetical protein